MPDVTSIMTADPTGQGLVEFARETANRLVHDNLTRAQIRNIFTEVRRIEALWDSDPSTALRRLNMLRPKLSYQTARAEPVGYLADVLSKAIEEVNKPQDTETRNKLFHRFMDLFEAILAYHRALGGRN